MIISGISHCIHLYSTTVSHYVSTLFGIVCRRSIYCYCRFIIMTYQCNSYNFGFHYICSHPSFNIYLHLNSTIVFSHVTCDLIPILFLLLFCAHLHTTHIIPSHPLATCMYTYSRHTHPTHTDMTPSPPPRSSSPSYLPPICSHSPPPPPYLTPSTYTLV